LFFDDPLGQVLAKAGASESAIVTAVRERDASLDWAKYTNRSDAEIRYEEIARKAIEYAEAPTLEISGNGQHPRADSRIGPMRDAPAWPEPPGPAAFHGPAGQVVEAVAPHTEADPVASMAAPAVAVG